MPDESPSMNSIILLRVHGCPDAHPMNCLVRALKGFISADRVVDDAWTEVRSGERISAYSKLSSVVTRVLAYSILSSFAVFVFAAHSFGLPVLFPGEI